MSSRRWEHRSTPSGSGASCSVSPTPTARTPRTPSSRTSPASRPDPMDATDPVEPLPTSWVFDLSGIAEGEDLVAVGGDLRAGTLLEAYRSGLFPMGLGEHGRRPMGWWSP